MVAVTIAATIEILIVSRMMSLSFRPDGLFFWY